MTTTYTPGPWTEFQDSNSHDILARDGSHVARIEPVNSLDPAGEQIANANLIAAAPDMLAALWLASEALTPARNGDEAKVLVAIDAAIAKATGA